ncbi:MAG: redoxin domain-containing protein [Planctomycetes bacterium]|nr:redoxin domain-containing protein [Planctomycetota bacterium]
MRNAYLFSLFAAAVLLTSITGSSLFAADKAPARATFGKPVKDFALKDAVSGKTIKTANLRGKIVVLVWYSPACLTCPSYNKRLQEFAAKYRKPKDGKQTVVLLAVCSNSGDTPAGLKSYSKSMKLNFPMLRDGDSRIANYFSIEKTCTFVILDGKGVMRYRGGFDDNLAADAVKQRYVEDAVKALLAGRKVPKTKTSSFG